MAILLKGQELADKVLSELKKKVVPRTLGLAVVQVGKDPASNTYVGKKRQMAEQLGIQFFLYNFPKNILEGDLKKAVLSIGESAKITGMIVQLPLPSSMDTKKILDCIPPSKDVDVLSSQSFGRFALGSSPILPPTVAAVKDLLKQYKIDVAGKHVVVVGAGRLVGLPLSLWLMREKATITIANSSTFDLEKITKSADILISGTGRAKLIGADMVKKGAVVIDAGTSVESGITKGDVDFVTVAKKAGFITPVPGGVGPLTVVHLFSNLLILPQGDG